MSRGDRWAAAAIALALGGCMRIYPDPELPDVEVEWLVDAECSADDDRVTISLFAVDTAAEAGAATVPCRDAGLRFDDVARLRYRLEAKLEDTAGTVLGGHETEIDLRDGLNERVFTFFGQVPVSNFRVAWTFDMGASCETLSATLVELQASMAGGGPGFFFGVPCEAPLFESAIPLAGTYTFTARAVAFDTVVATSPESAPFAITRGTLTDLGTLTLTPCGAGCPQIGPE